MKQGGLDMKALVIGMGGVGCALAIATVKASMDTAVLARSTTAQAIRNNGLKRTGLFGDKPEHDLWPADQF